MEESWRLSIAEQVTRVRLEAGRKNPMIAPAYGRHSVTTHSQPVESGWSRSCLPGGGDGGWGKDWDFFGTKAKGRFLHPGDGDDEFFLFNAHFPCNFKDFCD